MRYFSLGLMYTNKCNCKCDICGLNCTPLNSEKMELDEAKYYIDEAIKNNISVLGFTGGEPLIYIHDIEKLIRYAVEKGIKRTTLTTNGYWAENMNITYNTLEKLKECGLDHIKVSCDRFHNTSVPIENIKNVLRASEEIGIRITLGCVVTKDEKETYEILRQLKNYIFGHSITLYGCQYVGRCKDKIEKDDLYKKVTVNRCPECGTLIVTPNGNVYPCGAINLIESNITCGNLKRKKMNQIIEEIYSDKDFMHIFNKGICDYYEYVQEKFPGYIFVDECEVCSKIFTSLNAEERAACRMKKLIKN